VMASALQLPFADESIGTIGMLNVLHHLPRPELFFEEAQRALAPGGRIILIEPFVSFLSKIIFIHLHHEPFDPRSASWDLPEQGPMSTANDAMPYLIFFRDRSRFETLFPSLKIVRAEPHTVYSYIVSGGVSMRSLAPGFMFKPLIGLEKTLKPLYHQLAMLMTVEIQKV